MNALLLFAAFLVGVLAVTKGTEKVANVVRERLARGIRNNNPGNLRITSIPWRGKLPPEENTDGAFEQFYYPVDGIRALARDLKSKYARGLRSIRDILTVYAPPSENDTEAYIRAVTKRTGLPADSPVNVPAHLYELVTAMIAHENAGFEYPPEVVLQGVAAA